MPSGGRGVGAGAHDQAPIEEFDTVGGLTEREVLLFGPRCHVVELGHRHRLHLRPEAFHASLAHRQTGRSIVQRWFDSGPLATTSPKLWRPSCGVQSGMLPCFLGGNVSRFVRSARNARTSWTRVAEGLMTEST